MRSFDNWTYEEVENVFGLSMHRSGPAFNEWLEAKDCDPDPPTREALALLRDLLFEEALNWNEDELKLFFIGPVLGLVNFKTQYFKPFTQRTLTARYDDHTSSGKVDFLLAKGKVVPQNPYFCLHEYKPQLRGQSDPLGQLLVAMFAVSKINDDPQRPVLGCYVLGKFWHFVVLEGQEYASSASFDVSQDEILEVAAALKWCKRYIETHL